MTNDYSAAGALRSAVESAERLGVAPWPNVESNQRHGLPPELQPICASSDEHFDRAIHCLRIHDPNDNGTNPDNIDEVARAAEPDTGAASFLTKLRDIGRLREVSIGMNSNSEAHQGVIGSDWE
eukprot:SAG31_NODE_7796_length_1594_cov_6.293645_1_plen_124_part_00